jgi:copper transport protein
MKRTADPYRDLDFIDSRAPRFNQATVGVLSAVAIATGWWWLVAALATQLAIGLTFGRRFCLPCLAYFELVQPRFGEGPLEDARPPRFANLVGAVLLGSAAVLYATGFDVAGAALGAGAAALVLPGLAGHAGQRSPRGLALPLDAFHLASVSVWVGGLIGIVVFWLTVGREGRVAALRIVVPRFSNVAFCSVLLLIGTGIGQSLLELPTLGSLWQTNYGKALIAKISLLGVALVLAAVNLARTRPRLQASGLQPSVGPGAALLLRRLVEGEIVLVVGALFAAAVLTSLPPPASALARIKDIAARVGPGPVSQVVSRGPYKVHVTVTPNRAAIQNTFSVKVTKNGQPVRGANVVSRFDMLDMDMGELSYRFPQSRPGTFTKSAPALVMVGHWALAFEVTPPGQQPFVVTLLDKASG